MVTAWALGVVAVLAVVQAFDPALTPRGCVPPVATAGRPRGGRGGEGPRLRVSARRPPGLAGQKRAAAQDASSDLAAASRVADGAVAPLVTSA